MEVHTAHDESIVDQLNDLIALDHDAVAAYDAAIAREYAHLPREAYAAGRRAFLGTLAAAPRIYLSDYFHARLDTQARANLAAALAAQ